MIAMPGLLGRADRSYSLNAVQLGRLRMSVDECIDNYPHMAEEIFRTSRISFRGKWRSKYDKEKLRTEIEKIVQKKLPPITKDERTDERFKRFPSPEDLCKT